MWSAAESQHVRSLISERAGEGSLTGDAAREAIDIPRPEHTGPSSLTDKDRPGGGILPVGALASVDIGRTFPPSQRGLG